MSKEIIVPAINNLLDLNGWMIKWKPKELSRILDIPVSKLNNARQTEWFHFNDFWKVWRFFYETEDFKSRKNRTR